MKKIAVGILLLVIVIALIYGSTQIPTEQFAVAAAKLGIFGPILFVLFLVTADVIAPIVGSPFLFVAARLYGWGPTVLSGMIAVIYYFAFRSVGLETMTGPLLWLGSMGLVSVVFTTLLFRRMRKHPITPKE